MEKVPLKSAKFCLYNYTSHKISGLIKTVISLIKTRIDKYRVAANITEYHNISKLIFLKIIIPKFIMIRQSYHVKNIRKNVKNQHV